MRARRVAWALACVAGCNCSLMFCTGTNQTPLIICVLVAQTNPAHPTQTASSLTSTNEFQSSTRCHEARSCPWDWRGACHVNAAVCGVVDWLPWNDSTKQFGVCEDVCVYSSAFWEFCHGRRNLDRHGAGNGRSRKEEIIVFEQCYLCPTRSNHHGTVLPPQEALQG